MATNLTIIGGAFLSEGIPASLSRCSSTSRNKKRSVSSKEVQPPVKNYTDIELANLYAQRGLVLRTGND